VFIKTHDAKTTILGLVEKASKDFKVEIIKKIYWPSEMSGEKILWCEVKKKEKVLKFRCE
jgi:hypothetical protein